MSVFAAPNLFADFTSGLGTNSFIFNGITYPDFNTWLTTIGGTFSRSSTAYYTNSSGILTQAANNVARFDFDPLTLTSRGILIEGASTNVVTQSGFASGWSPSNATFNANALAAPDGTTTAYSLVSTVSGSNNVFVVSSGTFTLTASSWDGSIYAKAGTASNVKLAPNTGGSNTGVSFNLSSGTVIASDAGNTGTITPVGKGWFKLSVSFTGTAAGYSFQVFQADNAGGISPNANVGDTIYLWGPQLENLSFASSYIPTTAASASRSADILSATPISTWYNAANGTLYVFADSLQSSGRAVSINDTSQNNELDLIVSVSSGALALVRSGNSQIFQPQTTDSGQSQYSSGVAARAAISLAANNFTYVKGGAAADTASLGATPISPTQIEIGNLLNGSFIFGHVQQVGYWPIAFTTAQLQSLTTTGPTFDLNPTTLTNRSGRYFSRKDYAEWLDRIIAENEEANREYEKLVNDAETERGLTDAERADRDYNNAEEEYGQSEGALFNNLTSTNHIKFSEAKERRDKARKERDHHYYMAVVKKAWDEYNNK